MRYSIIKFKTGNMVPAFETDERHDSLGINAPMVSELRTIMPSGHWSRYAAERAATKRGLILHSVSHF